MFDKLQPNNVLTKSEFEEIELSLRWALLEAQFDLARLDYPVIINIGGLEGAGKGSMVHRLNEWMDSRGMETEPFWEHSDEEESRPHYWRYWRRLPPSGEIGVFIGSWYNEPGYAAIEEKLSREELDERCQEINHFERMLRVDGALILKIWLHVGEKYQAMQLAEQAPKKLQNPRAPVRLDHGKVSYKKQLSTARKILEYTNTGECPWYVVDAEDHNYRDVTVGQLILREMRNRAAEAHAPVTETSFFHPGHSHLPPVQNELQLDTLDLSLALDKDDYKKKLNKYQARLQDLAWEAHNRSQAVVAVFEGWDAAGKGSAIRRVTTAMDPRLYRVLQYAAPTDEERAHHYLWRFWRRLERDGRATVFDRSWYGRVLVERVEGFASEDEWRRAYAEINEFERQLVKHGSVLLKFWVHISPETQLQRFQEREREPHKQHKITEEDWRNREQWPAYRDAVEEMVARTHTAHAPWTLVEGDDKRHARIRILKTFCKALQENGG